MAREEDRCDTTRDRMVDDHNELKREHQAILSAMDKGFQALKNLIESKKGSDGFSNSDNLWRLGYVAAAAASYFFAKVML